MKRPSRILSEGSVISSAGIPERIGLLIQYKTRDELIKTWDSLPYREECLRNLEKALRESYTKTQPNLDVLSQVRREGWDAIGKLPAKDQSFLMMATQYSALKNGVNPQDSVPKELGWIMLADVIISQYNNICYLGSSQYQIATNGSIMQAPSITVMANQGIDDSIAKSAIGVIEQACDPDC